MKDLKGAAARSHQRKVLLDLARERAKDRDIFAIPDTVALFRVAQTLTTQKRRQHT